MNTTYTIANFRNDNVQSGLSARNAADELLSHDGAEYEVRAEADGTGFTLWDRKPNAGKPWARTVIYSVEADRAAAETEIFTKVIQSGYWERDDMFCGTDDAYAEMLAEMDAE